MLLRMEEWDRIRLHFTAEEKKRINDAITGEVVCPRGCTLDEAKLGPLAEKIRTLLQLPS